MGQQLRRVLRLPTVISNSAGFSFATSSFLALAQVLALAGGRHAWLAVLIAGCLVLPVANVFAELSRRHPAADALRGYLRAGFPDALALPVTMLYGLVMVAILGTEAYVLARAASAVLPQVPAAAWAGALLLGSTALNLRGAEAAGRFQNLVTCTMLASACTLGVVALAHPGAGKAPADAVAWPQAVAASVYLFVGFEWVTPRAEEAVDPRAVPRGLLLSVILLTGVFSLLAAAIGHLGTPLSGAAPQIAFAHGLGGRRWVLWMLAVCLAASATTFNAGTGAASRLLFGLARDGALPARLARVSARSGVPSAAVWCTAGGAALGALAVALTGGFIGLVDMGAMAESLIYAMAALALVRLDRRAWPHLLTAAAFAALAVFAAVDGGPAVPLTLGLACLAVAGFQPGRRRAGAGPAATRRRPPSGQRAQAAMRSLARARVANPKRRAPSQQDVPGPRTECHAAEIRRGVRSAVEVLTPLDIHNKDFRKGMRGYREDEVDDFLDKVVADFEALLKENATLKDQATELQQRIDQYRQLETTLHSTLIVAQETADAVKESARKEAELIVQEAEARAQATREREAAEIKRAEEHLAELGRRTIAFRAQVRSLLESQLEMLRGDDAVAEAAAARQAQVDHA